METYRVIVPGLFVRRIPAKTGNVPLGTMPKGTVFERVGPEESGWAPIRVHLGGIPIVGWAALGAEYAVPVGPPPAGLPASLFRTQARGEYVEWVLNDADRKNFLRPAQQAWDAGQWIHGVVTDGGQTVRVAADWAAAKRGELRIVTPTHAAAPLPGHAATFCNFNITFCYTRAYGGPSLQFMDGREWSANELVEALSVRWSLVGAAEAARIANAGGFVIAGKQAPGHGHVVFLLEDSDETGDPMGIRAFHAGAGEPRIRQVGNIWNAQGIGVRYIVPPATLAAWRNAV